MFLCLHVQFFRCLFSSVFVSVTSHVCSLFFFFLPYFNCSHTLSPTLCLCPRLSLVSLCRAELQASDSRYQAQRRITQLLQTELLQLYSRVEMEAPASTATTSPPGGRADPHTRADSRSGSEQSVTSVQLTTFVTFSLSFLSLDSLALCYVNMATFTTQFYLLLHWLTCDSLKCLLVMVADRMSICSEQFTQRDL